MSGFYRVPLQRNFIRLQDHGSFNSSIFRRSTFSRMFRRRCALCAPRSSSSRDHLGTEFRGAVHTIFTLTQPARGEFASCSCLCSRYMAARGLRCASDLDITATSVTSCDGLHPQLIYCENFTRDALLSRRERGRDVHPRGKYNPMDSDCLKCMNTPKTWLRIAEPRWITRISFTPHVLKLASGW